MVYITPKEARLLAKRLDQLADREDYEKGHYMPEDWPIFLRRAAKYRKEASHLRVLAKQELDTTDSVG